METTVTRETLIEWLRDAHAMEHQAIETLERQAERIEHYPELKAKVQNHLEESRWQAEQVKKCLERLGSDSSTIKKGVGKFMGNMSALTNSAAGDEIVKNGIADYAFEHFEIASYRSLVAAADELGQEKVKRVCQEILKQEEHMADWLEDHLPEVTQQYLRREATSQQAKR
jgi:ferritin-like metal-binding protein YciE